MRRPLRAQEQARVQALAAHFREVVLPRMAGVPILHPGLSVATVGFAAEPDAGLSGVLVTPWFMNLIWLPPESVEPSPAQPARAGTSRRRAVGCRAFDFIAGHETGIGSYEACSLFSPMDEFADQAAALATAQAVAELLDTPDETQATTDPRAGASTGASAPAATATAAADADTATAAARCPGPAAEPMAASAPARRSFLFGRRAA